MTEARETVFVSGMLRSGTSLLQVLLTNHPDMLVVYQPFHQLYVDVKRKFLEEAGIDRLLPLGDDMNASPSENARFGDWLRARNFSTAEAAELVRDSVTGKGGSCASISGHLPVTAGGFFQIHRALHAVLREEFGRPDARYVGAKEVLCEEYVPHLARDGCKCLLIIRDPRAVIASANHGSYRQLVGDRYPLLMLIRLWRKSAAYFLAMRDHPNAHTLRFEDLAAAPEHALQQVTEFLGVSELASGALDRPLLDHTGAPWFGNSSFGDKLAVDRGASASWQSHLAPTEQAFIEACCYGEMRALGYTPELDADRCEEVIRSFEEETAEVRATYLELCGLCETRRREEIARFRAIIDRTDSIAPLHFIVPKALDVIRDAMRETRTGRQNAKNPF